jgi:lipoate synthase
MKKPRQSRIRDDSADLSPSVTYSVPAGTKTIDVIEYMAQAQAPQTKSEIAAGIGKSIQEVYRIIQLLVARGYLVSELIAMPVPPSTLP